MDNRSTQRSGRPRRRSRLGWSLPSFIAVLVVWLVSQSAGGGLVSGLLLPATIAAPLLGLACIGTALFRTKRGQPARLLAPVLVVVLGIGVLVHARATHWPL